MGEGLNAALLQRDHRHLVHSLHNEAAHLAGNVWVRGEGTDLIDADGRRYVDAMSGLWNVTLGYGRRELVDAAARQMSELAYASGYAGSTNLRALRARRTALRLRLPGTSTASSSRRAAASRPTARSRPRATTGRRSAGRASARRSACSAATTGHAGGDVRDRDAGLLAVVRAAHARLRAHPQPRPLPLRRAAGRRPGIGGRRRARRAILAEGPESVALFIAEPVMGGGIRAAGGLPPHPRDLRPLRRAVRRRRGDHRLRPHRYMFALDHWGVQPDLVQFAGASRAATLPLGGSGCRTKVAAVFDRPRRGHLDALLHLQRAPGGVRGGAGGDRGRAARGQPARAGVLGARLLRGLRDALGHPNVGDIRGLGLIAAVELVEDRAQQSRLRRPRRSGRRCSRSGGARAW